MPGPQEKNDSVGSLGYMYMQRKCVAVEAKGKISNFKNHFSRCSKAGIIK